MTMKMCHPKFLEPWSETTDGYVDHETKSHHKLAHGFITGEVKNELSYTLR